MPVLGAETGGRTGDLECVEDIVKGTASFVSIR
jgi:hypothetical protein